MAFPRCEDGRVWRLLERLGYHPTSWCDMKREVLSAPSAYVNRGPEHMPLGLAERLAHDARLAERGERDES